MASKTTIEPPREIPSAYIKSLCDGETEALEGMASSLVRLLQTRRLLRESGHLGELAPAEARDSAIRILGEDTQPSATLRSSLSPTASGGSLTPGGSTGHGVGSDVPRPRRTPSVGLLVREGRSLTPRGSPSPCPRWRGSIHPATKLSGAPASAISFGMTREGEATASGGRNCRRSSPSSPERSFLAKSLSSAALADSLLAACIVGNGVRVEALMKRPDRRNLLRSTEAGTLRSPLHLSARHGHVAICKSLIDRAADLHAQEQHGATALALASMYGHSPVVRLLVNFRAQAEATDHMGRNAFHFACCCGNPEVVSFLLSRQPAIVNTTEACGRNGLFYALANLNPSHRLDISELLLNNHCDANHCGHDGRSALWYATRAGCAESVQLMLKYGPQPESHDGNKGRQTTRPMGTELPKATQDSRRLALDDSLREPLGATTGKTSLEATIDRRLAEMVASHGVFHDPLCKLTAPGLHATKQQHSVPEATRLDRGKESQGEKKEERKEEGRPQATQGKGLEEFVSCLSAGSPLAGGGATKQQSPEGAKIRKAFHSLMEEHPFLKPGGSGTPHYLLYWMRRGLECLEMEGENEAMGLSEALACMERVAAGLSSDKRRIQAAFKRFDADGSGSLDHSELQSMCAYLGWGEEEASAMDFDKDGVITLQEFEAVVGSMGGVQRLFELRRQRVAVSRSDVCRVAGVAVGSRVRAHYYVGGRKSYQCLEATVLAVGVQPSDGSCGPAPLLTTLEFGFGEQSPWKARQNIPPSWIVSDVADASVAAALREVGILEEEQGFWASILPVSEMRAIERLVGCQRAALAHIRAQATMSHEASLPQVHQRFLDLGLSESELHATLNWVQDLAPVVVHVNIDTVGPFMEIDEYYRNQFETKTSCGLNSNDVRTSWERDLFGESYNDAKPFDRCKYGALNVTNDYRGVTSALQYGDSYLVLKDVRLRCTFAATDSGGISGSRLAVLDKYAHVLQEYADDELRALVSVATAGSTARPPEELAELLRGGAEDSTMEWVTVGYPRLAQSRGRMYFEVVLFEGCASPQVGLLSSKFERKPCVPSNTGVGDDDHGWAVDGQHSARFHGGRIKGWQACWPTTLGALSQDVLSKEVVVGVAVDLDGRRLWFSSDGVWDRGPAFVGNDLPEGVELYPALSLQGSAAFLFGPEFRNEPLILDGKRFARWPGAPSDLVRIDCPRVGNSDALHIYKEAQIHGELNLKRHVQRLVANHRYRDTPKTQRSWSVRVAGAGPCNGTYRRAGVHENMPLYKSEKGAIIFWVPGSWRMNDLEDFDSYRFSAPTATDEQDTEPPRRGWEVPAEEKGSVCPKAFQTALVSCGFRQEDVDRILKALGAKDSNGRPVVYRIRCDTSLEAEWAMLTSPQTSAEDAWASAVEESCRSCLASAGFHQVEVVETAHPYGTEGWTRVVRLPGVSGLSIRYVSSSCTYDSCTRVSVHVGDVCAENAGEGARVAVCWHDGGCIFPGTVAERQVDGRWRVKLDSDTFSAWQDPQPANREAQPTGSGPFPHWTKGDQCFALCLEEPMQITVRFGGAEEHIRSEISDFALDLSFPLTPIRVKSFAGPGPAQAAGVKAGWFIDLEATLFGPSSASIARLEGEGLGQMPEDVEGAFRCVDCVHRRLQLLLDEVCTEEVALVFHNGARAQLLRQAHVHYPGKVGEDVAVFEANPDGVLSVTSFVNPGSGPAFRAGVRAGWRLDLHMTLCESPRLAEASPEDSILEDPSSLLAASDAILVFEASPSMAFEGSGPVGSDIWKRPVHVAGDFAEFRFETDGDGTSYPDACWGFVALVLPADSAMMSQEEVDKLAAAYTAVRERAKGVADGVVSVERDHWDEQRLQALCARHGWDFEWLAQDGERRRRLQEFQGQETGLAAATTVASATWRKNSEALEAEKPDHSVDFRPS